MTTITFVPIDDCVVAIETEGYSYVAIGKKFPNFCCYYTDNPIVLLCMLLDSKEITKEAMSSRTTKYHGFQVHMGHYLLQCLQAPVNSQSISQCSGSRVSNSIPFKTVEESAIKLTLGSTLWY